MSSKLFVVIVVCISQLWAITSKAGQFEIDGVVLGEVATGTKDKYECKPSDQFKGHTWCSSFLQSGTGKGKSSTRQSILLAPDNRALYLNRVSISSDFRVDELKAAFLRKLAEFGLQATLLKPPPQLQSPSGILAIWGGLKVVEVDAVSRKILAAGKSPQIGFLVDFLNDIEESARRGLPIYRLAEGRGYVWSVSFGQDGISRRRSIAIDATALLPESIAMVSLDECLVASHVPSSSSDLRQGDTQISVGLLSVVATVQRGNFRCHSESNDDGVGSCDSKVANLDIRLDTRKIFFPQTAYAGLEGPSSVRAIQLNKTKFALLFDVGDGSASATVCFIVSGDSVVRRAKIITPGGEDGDVVTEDTRFN